jgi:hypothetical protein
LAVLESLSFPLYGKRQAKKKFTVSGNKEYHELAVVLKLQCMTILSTQKRKYETKTFYIITKIFRRKFEPAVCRSRKREA